MGKFEKGEVTDILLTLEKKGYDDVLVLGSQQFMSAFTTRRKEIIETIRNNPPLSVTELADKVDREKSAVSRDLGDLYEHNIIDFEVKGRNKYPVLKHDMILAKPIILDNELDEKSDLTSENHSTEEQKENLEMQSVAEEAIEDLGSGGKHDDALKTLLQVAESNPEVINKNAAKLVEKLDRNPELLDPIVEIVEILSATDAESVPRSLLIAVLNAGMDLPIGKSVSVDDRQEEK